MLSLLQSDSQKTSNKSQKNTFQKCSENASKKVQNQKIFLPREGDTPFPKPHIILDQNQLLQEINIHITLIIHYAIQYCYIWAMISTKKYSCQWQQERS